MGNQPNSEQNMQTGVTDDIQQQTNSISGAPTPDSPMTPLQKKFPSKKTLIAIVIAVVVLLLGGVVALTVSNQHKSEVAGQAEELLNSGNYAEAKELYQTITGYKNADEQILKCDYLSAMEMVKEENYSDAAEIFASLGDYENSATLATLCSNAFQPAQLTTDIALSFNTANAGNGITMALTSSDEIVDGVKYFYGILMNGEQVGAMIFTSEDTVSDEEINNLEIINRLCFNFAPFDENNDQESSQVMDLYGRLCATIMCTLSPNLDMGDAYTTAIENLILALADSENSDQAFTQNGYTYLVRAVFMDDFGCLLCFDAQTLNENSGNTEDKGNTSSPMESFPDTVQSDDDRIAIIVETIADILHQKYTYSEVSRSGDMVIINTALDGTAYEIMQTITEGCDQFDPEWVAIRDSIVNEAITWQNNFAQNGYPNIHLVYNFLNDLDSTHTKTLLSIVDSAVVYDITADDAVAQELQGKETSSKNIAFLDPGTADKEYDLAWNYFNGNGVEQSYAVAAKLFEFSAEKGKADSQYVLAWMYSKGMGVEQNYATAAQWYEKAANQGLSDAQMNLGWLYRYGFGVAQDYEKAVELFTQSANQGNANGQFNLGSMYEYGLGVEQDYEKAAELYQKAANQGLSAAKDSLNNIKQHLNTGSGNFVPRGSGVYKNGAELMNSDDAEVLFPGISPAVEIPVDIRCLTNPYPMTIGNSYKRVSWHIYEDGKVHNFGQVGPNGANVTCYGYYWDAADNYQYQYLVKLDDQYFWVSDSMVVSKN